MNFNTCQFTFNILDTLVKFILLGFFIIKLWKKFDKTGYEKFLKLLLEKQLNEKEILLWNFLKKFKNVAFSGTIGAGKSTMIEELKNRYGSNIFVRGELNEQTLFFLEKYKTDPKAFSLVTQLAFGFNRIYDETQIDRVCISDRFLQEDELFAKLQNLQKIMSDDEYKMYNHYIEKFKEMMKLPDLVFFLKVKTNTSLNRSRKRQLPEEPAYELDYLNQLNENYEIFEKEMKQKLGENFIVIDWDEDIPENEIFDTFYSKISGKFLK